MRVGVSWSGGKDSCLACYKAMQQGHRLDCLLNMVSSDSKRCCFHGVDPRLIERQASLMGIPLLQKAMSAGMDEYEAEFKAALRDLRQEHGIEGMVFGDVYLDEHKQWVERVCGEEGLTALEPLWGMDPRKVVEEFLAAGFRAIIVSCKADVLGQEYAGRNVDDGLLRDLTARGICPCGENGEYHTLVTAGPLFRAAIEIRQAVPVLREGFWKHWALVTTHHEDPSAHA